MQGGTIGKCADEAGRRVCAMTHRLLGGAPERGAGLTTRCHPNGPRRLPADQLCCYTDNFSITGPRLLEGLGLEAHDGRQVALEPDAVADELRQLLVDQAFLLLKRLPRGCARPRAARGVSAAPPRPPLLLKPLTCCGLPR